MNLGLSLMDLWALNILANNEDACVPDEKDELLGIIILYRYLYFIFSLIIS